MVASSGRVEIHDPESFRNRQPIRGVPAARWICYIGTEGFAMTSDDRIIRDLLEKIVAGASGDDLVLELGRLTTEQRSELAQLLIDRRISLHNSN